MAEVLDVCWSDLPVSIERVLFHCRLFLSAIVGVGNVQVVPYCVPIYFRKIFVAFMGFFFSARINVSFNPPFVKRAGWPL